MELVTSFNTLVCPFQFHGLRKIAMDYYYCKDCDKEEKNPMCLSCILKCHKGHTSSEIFKASETDLQRCNCAMNNHQTSTEEGNYSLYTCYFSDLNKNNDHQYCYKNSHKKQICDFCYTFCRNGSKEEPEFKLPFKKVFINTGGIIHCQCPSFKNSKHTAVDFMNKCLGDLNKSSETYYPNISPCILINMFFESDELFRSVNKKFIDIFNNILTEYGDKEFNTENIDSNQIEENYMKIPVIINRTYLIFSKNAKNCKLENNLIFSKEIINYYSNKVMKIYLSNCEIGAKGGKGHYKTEESFYESFLYGYKIFNLQSTLKNNYLPTLRVREFINLNPFQRLNIMKMASQLNFEINYILNCTKTLIKTSANFASIRILLQLFGIIKIFASYYLISLEQMIDFLKIVEIFFINFENIRNISNNDNILYIRLFIKITKILIYFSYYMNDTTFLNNMNNYYESLNIKKYNVDKKEDNNYVKVRNNFIYVDSELSRSLSKNLIHVTKFFEIEYNLFKVEHNINNNLYLKLMKLIQLLINLGFNKKDIYSSGIKRLITSNSKAFCNYLIKDKFESDDKKILLDEINIQQKILNDKLNEFYTSSKESTEIYITFSYSLDKVYDILNLKYIDSFNNNDLNLNNNENNNNLIESNINNSINNTNRNNNNNKITNNVLLNVNKDNMSLMSKKELDNSQQVLEDTNKVDLKIKLNNTKKSLKSSLISQSGISNSELKKTFTEKNEEINPNLNIFEISTYLITLSKIFHISKNKTIFDDKFCRKVLYLFKTYLNNSNETNDNHLHIKNVNANIENIFQILTEEIINNLSEMPYKYIIEIFRIIVKTIKSIIKSDIEISTDFSFLTLAYNLFERKVKKDDINIYCKCLSKLLKIVNLLKKLKFTFNIKWNKYIKDHIFINNDFINYVKLYKDYLLEINKDFENNKTFYQKSKNYYNEKIFEKFFPNINNPIIIYKLILYYLKLVTDFFEGNSNLSDISFLRDYFSPWDLIKITKITTLDIKLRILFLKIFRITYIDILIEPKKLDSYRTEFQYNIDERLEENLFNIEQSKIFKFYDLLMGVNPPKISEEEYDLLIQETVLFKSVLKYSNIIQVLEKEFNNRIYFDKNFKPIENNYEDEDNDNTFINYFENGIILPLVIYLNKLFSIVNTFQGDDLLKIYKLTFNILEMIKYYNEICNSDFKKYMQEPLSLMNLNKNKTMTLEKTKTLRKTLTQRRTNNYINTTYKDNLINDLNLLSNKNNSPMNYYFIYQILIKHLLKIFESPIARKNVTYLSEFNIDEEDDLEEFKNVLLKKNSKIFEKDSYNNEIFELYQFYNESKNNMDNNSFKAIFDLNYSGNENSFRTVLCKYLLLLVTDEYNAFEKDSLYILLKLLMNETNQTQNSIIELYNNNEFTKIYVIIENCFTNILSTVLSQFNPSLMQFNDDYYTSCAMIKLFKFLCEEHNQFFQKFFLKQFYFSLNDIQKIGFYDMFLFILEKIIILSCWKQVKKPEDFHNYFVLLFSCIIELLIEIIQGTEDSNFLSLINQKYEGNQKLMVNANRMDPVLKKGKALDSFLKCVKSIITCDDQNSEDLDNIRKLLMDFFLAFMEENHCPMEIKLMIIINFHASSIIKSISTILKKIYIKRKMEEDNLYKNETKEEKMKRRRTLIFIDSHSNNSKKNKSEEKLEKELNKIYFNNEMCKIFRSLYFEDEEFSESPSFQLCCSFYNYFKLTLLKCKDSETQAFWDKIHCIKKDDLESFNTQTENETFISDGSDFEAYYVIKLFEQISRSVLVKTSEDKPPIFVIFTKPPCLNYLSLQTKNSFLKTVNRTSRNTKLIDLMEQSEYFKIEAEYNFNKLRNNPILRKLCWMDYSYFCFFIFLVDIGLNIFMLSVNHESGQTFEQSDKKYYTIIRIISLFFSFIVFGAIMLWSFTKVELYKKIETARYIHLNQLQDIDSLSLMDKINICMNSYLSHNELKILLYFLVFRIIGSIHLKLAFFYSFSLLSVIYQSETLSILPNAFSLKGRQLSWVSAFTIITLYVYSGWGFYYLKSRFYDTDNRDTPENMCDSLLYCFFTQIINGFRWYPGIGKVLRIDSAIKHESSYIHNYIYHFTFYLIIRVMMIKIIFGIILESFTELRDLKNNIDRDLKYRCFICNIEKDECEKQNEDFFEHCNRVHNVWDYADYIIMLRMTDFQDLNGVNTMCKEMILERQPKWVPDRDHGNDEGNE